MFYLLVKIRLFYLDLTRCLNKKSAAIKHDQCLQLTQSDWNSPEDYVNLLEKNGLLQ